MQLGGAMREIDVRIRLFTQAVVLSGLLNILMVFLPALVVGQKSKVIFGSISDAIAAPTGIITGTAFAPKQHTVASFMSAVLESLVFSFLFYLAVFWLVLECFYQIKIRLQRTSEPS
jgi:hypothetical protein